MTQISIQVTLKEAGDLAGINNRDTNRCGMALMLISTMFRMTG
jgi:hypothetical protein